MHLRFLVILLSFIAFNSPAQDLKLKEPVRLLSLGDSYTIGESVAEPGRWPNQLADSLAARNIQVDSVAIIATTGWRTDNLITAITGDQLDQQGFNLVSLLIGVNNQFQNRPISTYKVEFQQLLDSALRYAGNDSSAVFVVSIPDYGFTPFGQNSGNQSGISAGVDAFNAINDSITAAYGLRYFNITPISREGINTPSLVATDGLHPSAEQYTLWVERMLGHIDSTLNTSISKPATSIDFEIFPQPNNGQFTIKGLANGEQLSLHVFDLTGRTVHLQKVQSTHDLNLQLDLPAGTYLLQLENHGAHRLVIR